MKIININKLLSFVLILVASHTAYAQLSDGFDIKKAYQDAKNKNIAPNILEEYVNHQHVLYLSAIAVNCIVLK